MQGTKRQTCWDYQRPILTAKAPSSTLRMGFQVKLNWAWLDLVLVKSLLSPPCPSLKMSPTLTCSWELEVSHGNSEAENPEQPVPSDQVPADT